MPYRSGRSTGLPRDPPRGGPRADVYLLPAVVGGGLGDIEEVLAAGRRLDRAGFSITLFRRPDHPLPTSVDGPWDWPRHLRVRALRPRSSTALTIAPAWGVSAAPARSGPLGRPGPWAEEVAEIERTYGPDRVLHVSLEEFARTLDPRTETRERLREGGVEARAIPDRLRSADHRGEVEQFRISFERFRAFDRPNVLPLFATFHPSAAFARAFPGAVQTGPLWPGAQWDGAVRRAQRPPGRREWVWYASPASAERIAPKVLEGLATIRPRVDLYVRSPRPWSSVPTVPRLTLETGPLPATAWRRRFAGAELRIVTGSRTLLEALEADGPFLYFNGVLGAGRRTRRHRPEKVAALLGAGRSGGAPRSLLTDLARFARGEDVVGVVRRAARRPRADWERLRSATLRRAFRSPYDDLGDLLVAVATAMSQPGASAPGLVGRVRLGSRSLALRPRPTEWLRRMRVPPRSRAH